MRVSGDGNIYVGPLPFVVKCLFLRGSSRFTMKEYSPQGRSVRMVRQAHHERRKTAHPERVEGLGALRASAVSILKTRLRQESDAKAGSAYL